MIIIQRYDAKEEGNMKKKYVILAVAVVMMLVGIYNNEAKIVLSKGVRICLECIGIG